MKHSVIVEGEAAILHVWEELDALSSAELRPVLDSLVKQGRRAVRVDLSELRLIDASGVGALVSLYKRIRENGGEVSFIGVKAQPLVVFKLLRLDRAFELSPSLGVVAQVGVQLPRSADETSLEMAAAR